ncbi:1-phosphofructokinase family hexose kinase [Streptomyces sp. NPDC088812]|uniref:1-phosphofructokinase family hexose kinase n=1 Tax=Streptomyces sp. NPDC088812 TaxID=3365905 RepID=UPI0038300203
MTITTVTLNAAVDVTYTVDRIRTGASHRLATARHRAGGKGVNVARVLTALGRPALVAGLAGGPAGDAVRRDLAASGMAEALTAIAGTTRQTVTVVEEAAGDAAVFLEPGPEVSAAEWRAFTRHFARLLGRSRAVVLSGSLPPGLSEDAYGELVAAARRSDVPVVLDTTGPPLLAALAAGPDLVKPNAAELRETVGAEDVRAGAETLRRAGARSVVVSLGAEGLLAVAPDGVWRARPPERLAGNPTGAGDAAVAALAAGLADRTPWPERLRAAVALSAAAVRAPLAGDFDAPAYRDLLSRTAVTALPAVTAVPTPRPADPAAVPLS